MIRVSKITGAVHLAATATTTHCRQPAHVPAPVERNRTPAFPGTDAIGRQLAVTATYSLG
jgi:hypothetical protein